MIKIENLDEFHAHVLERFPFEACGLVIEGKFIAIANISDDPINNFQMEAGTYLTYSDKIELILHSHTALPNLANDSRCPSKSDMALARNTNLPMGIVATNGDIVTPILEFNLPTPEPILGRRYIHNVYDCYTLVRDYYILERNFLLDIIPREVEWYKQDEFLLLDNLDQGLRKLQRHEELEKDDVLIFRVNTLRASHCGIYTGEDKFLHHLNDRLSREDRLSKWEKQLLAAYRLEK